MPRRAPGHMFRRMAVHFLEVDDIGPVRQANAWEIARIKHMGDKANAAIAWIAFPAGLTVQQFKKLKPEKQAELRAAVRALGETNVSSPKQ